MSELDIKPKFPLQNINDLKQLIFLKRKYLKRLNYEMTLYIKLTKVNKIYKEITGDTFDNNCLLEVDMQRNLEIIYKLDNLIHNIELGDGVTDLDNYQDYAKYILKRDDNIEND